MPEFEYSYLKKIIRHPGRAERDPGSKMKTHRLSKFARCVCEPAWVEMDRGFDAFRFAPG